MRNLQRKLVDLPFIHPGNILAWTITAIFCIFGLIKLTQKDADWLFIPVGLGFAGVLVLLAGSIASIKPYRELRLAKAAKTTELKKEQTEAAGRYQHHIEAVARQVRDAGYEGRLEEMAVHEHEQALDELSDSERLFFYDTGLMVTSPGDRVGFTKLQLTDIGRGVADELFELRESEDPT